MAKAMINAMSEPVYPLKRLWCSLPSSRRSLQQRWLPTNGARRKMSTPWTAFSGELLVVQIDYRVDGEIRICPHEKHIAPVPFPTTAAVGSLTLLHGSLLGISTCINEKRNSIHILAQMFAVCYNTSKLYHSCEVSI